MRRWLAILLAAILAGCSGTKVEYEDVEIGFRGPARQDPFLAANRMLADLGFSTRKSVRLSECLKQYGGTIITPLQSFVNRGETDDVVKWTRNGGHFVLLLAGGESWRDDWKQFDFADFWAIFKKQEVAEQKRLMAALGIKSVSHSTSDSVAVKVRRERMNAELHGNIDFETKPDSLDVTAGEKDSPGLASFRLGRGRVTLLAHAHPWRNRYIGEKDHAELLVKLLRLNYNEGDVWFLNGVRISFWMMLWERAWLAISLLALLLVVWLARHFRRLGPVAPLKTESARDFSDHLLLTGAFLWRHREGDSLVRPVQNAIITAARRRGWSELDDEFFRFIAEMSGLNIERARAIITSAAPTDPHAFRLLMQDLKKMLDALGA